MDVVETDDDEEPLLTTEVVDVEEQTSVAVTVFVIAVATGEPTVEELIEDGAVVSRFRPGDEEEEQEEDDKD